MEEQAQALQESHTRTQTLQEELDALRTAFEEAEKQHNKDASGAALRIQELQQALDVAHAALNALEEKHLQAVDEKKTQLEQLAKEHEASLNEATRQKKIISDEAAKELKQLQFRNKITNDALKGSQEQTKDSETQLEQLQEELHALRATSEQRQEEAQNRLNALEKEVAAGHSTIAGEFDDCSLCPSFVQHLFPIGPLFKVQKDCMNTDCNIFSLFSVLFVLFFFFFKNMFRSGSSTERQRAPTRHCGQRTRRPIFVGIGPSQTRTKSHRQRSGAVERGGRAPAPRIGEIAHFLKAATRTRWYVGILRCLTCASFDKCIV